MAQKEGFVSPLSTLVGPLGSKAALRPYSPPRGSNPSAPPNFLCKNKRRCLKMAKAGHERQRLFPQHFWASENRVQKERHSRNYFHKEFQVE